MKNHKIKIGFLIVIFCGIIFTSQAQEKLKEKDLVDTTWKMIFKIENKIKEEVEDSNTILEGAIINFVANTVGKTLDNLEIYFQFKNDNKLIVTSKAMGEDETKEGTWKITKDGKLRFNTVKIKINQEHDEDWFLYDSILIQQSQIKEKAVYMIKIN